MVTRRYPENVRVPRGAWPKHKKKKDKRKEAAGTRAARFEPVD